VKISKKLDLVKKQKEILNENCKLLGRLIFAKTNYPKDNWEKHAENHFWNKMRL